MCIRDRVNTTQLKVEGRVGALKKELYERIDEHIVRAQETIQEMYQTEIRQIKKLSSDTQLVEKYITTHSKKIVELRSQINEVLQKRPIAIDRIESKIDLVAESYQHLTENLDEGLLNEPITADPVDNTEFVTADQLKDHYRLFLNRIEEQLSTLGGGGEVQLRYLDDIVGVATNIAAYNGKFLRYNHGLGKFEFVSNGPWVDSFESDVRIGIHTLTNVAINTSIISRSDSGNLGLNPLTIQGNEVHGSGIHTCNVMVFTNEGDIGLGTTNPTHFQTWNTLTLDGNKRSTTGFVGGGDLVMKADGVQFVDIYTYKGSDSYSGEAFKDTVIAAFNKPFTLSGPIGAGQTIHIDRFNVGFGTYIPRRDSANSINGMDIRDADLYVGIGNTRGVVLTSPNGTAYRLVVDDSGNLSTTAV